MNASPEIIVIGAGPVGLTIALLLARRGHTVSVVERWPAPYPLPRAIAISAESMRVMQAAGVAESARTAVDIEWERHVTGDYVDPKGEPLLTMSFPIIGESGWPSMSSFNQPDLEAVLETACRANPLIDVHRGLVLEAFQQDENSVSATMKPAQGDGAAIAMRASWLIGADGANSTVRALAAIPWHDLGFASDWLVVDIRPHEKREWFPYIGQTLDARPTTFAPSGRGRRRFEFMALPGETPAMLNQKEVAWQLLAPWGVTPENAELVRHAAYTYRGCWAEQWRSGRVLLAGDAAHQMPPLMAQGLNSGFRDAIALAWRLDMVLSGAATPSLLDTYGQERLPHVRQIIDQSVAFGHLICVTDPEARAQRDAMLRAVRENPALAPPMPPPWRLGEGVLAEGDATAGFLGVQANVRVDGRCAMFDDVFGSARFALLSNVADPAGALSPQAADIWRALGGISALVTPQAAIEDVTGAYAAWFEALGRAVVLMRPDFQVFGSAEELSGADALVLNLARRLHLTVA